MKGVKVMSRVRKPGNKFMNVTKHDHAVTYASSMKRYKGENVDYTKADTLSSWLFLKYDISYKTYRNKSKNTRNELREEYMRDTGRQYFTKREQEEAETYALLTEIGVPLDPVGDPTDIGQDD